MAQMKSAHCLSNFSNLKQRDNCLKVNLEKLDKSNINSDTMNFEILRSFVYICIFTCYSALAAVDFGPKIGQVTGLPIPRYVSLKSNEINLRAGPGMQYPIRYIYRCVGYPMKVIAEFEHWRLLKDNNNIEGWVHKSLISSQSNVIIKGNYTEKQLPYDVPDRQAVIFTFPDEESYPIARVEFGAVAMLKKCSNHWCYININKKYNGWIRKENLHGLLLGQ